LLAEHLNSTWDNRLRPKDLVKRYYISLKVDDGFLIDFIKDRNISKVNPILLDLQSLLDTDKNIDYLFHKDRFSKSKYEKAKTAYWISI
jgi:acid phosphatase class B